MRQAIQPSRLFRGFCLVWAIFLFGSCSDPACVDPFQTGAHNIMEWVNHDALPRRDAEDRPLDQLVLYLDSSLSMQGYADPDGAFEYAKALRAVRNVVDQLVPRHRIQYRQVQENIGPLSAQEQTIFEAARKASFYKGGASNLASAIRSFEDQIQEDAPGVARCHILVTDGVQHTRADSPDPDCTRGNDPVCVNSAVRRLIDRGWGVHLFGVRSRFNGPIFSELRQKWLPGRYQVAQASAKSRFRPFLIYLFTNEADYLEHLVEKFRLELSRSGIDEDLIRELPLTLRLVEASRVDLETSPYRVLSEYDFGNPVPNPVVHHSGRTWREDFDGVELPDNVRILEYQYEDLSFLEPFAVHISAQLEFTPAGRILFGHPEADAGNLIQTLTLRSVERPPAWSRADEAAADEALQGTGRSADGLDDDSADEEKSPAAEPAASASPAWLDCGEYKYLNFNGVLKKELPDYMTMDEDAAACSLRGGCHLILKWGTPGDLLPFTLLRVDGLLDPSKILLPSWIDDWSTPDDSRLQNANKILNLNRLVRGLIDNEHIAKQGLKPYYLLIWPSQI